MKILIFGASGMVGQGVLRECLAADDVAQVTLIVRAITASAHPKLRQIVLADLLQLQTIEAQLSGYDACFYCLGVSSSGMDEAAYGRLTYDLTLTAASLLARLNPQMVFTYVSGAGTDSTETGPVMWARIKGKTENALQRLPFSGVYLFRPGVIQPLHGIRSKTRSYRLFYTLTKPLLPLARKMFPKAIVSTEDVGRAMLNAARRGTGRVILEAGDIARLGRD